MKLYDILGRQEFVTCTPEYKVKLNEIMAKQFADSNKKIDANYIYMCMSYAFNLGRIYGKREERAKRK